MKLELKRTWFANQYTIGNLFVNGVHLFDTLEDKVRIFSKDGHEKIKHQTAVPKGSYKVIINYSNRFKCKMPLLVNVPFFEGIRIHSGNNHLNTSGCILIGYNSKVGELTGSKIAFAAFYDMLKIALRNEDVSIEIS